MVNSASDVNRWWQLPFVFDPKDWRTEGYGRFIFFLHVDARRVDRLTNCEFYRLDHSPITVCCNPAFLNLAIYLGVVVFDEYLDFFLSKAEVAVIDFRQFIDPLDPRNN